ncbi:MAG: hypothetical protein VX733_07625 [Candidatus Latescibacterota bacterium]|nr:hypothetical protein [Candidatus Latescibacterota bacterium]
MGISLDAYGEPDQLRRHVAQLVKKHKMNYPTYLDHRLEVA